MVAAERHGGGHRVRHVGQQGDHAVRQHAAITQRDGCGGETMVNSGATRSLSSSKKTAINWFAGALRATNTHAPLGREVVGAVVDDHRQRVGHGTAENPRHLHREKRGEGYE